MIGIIGPVGDEQVCRVREQLVRRGVEPAVLDLTTFPATTKVSLHDGVPSAGGLDVSAIRAWYVRSLPLPLPFLADGRRDYAAGRERRSFVTSFVAALARDGATFVNPPAVMAQHFLKLDQLQRLRDAGIPVPMTHATNDPAAVLDFARALDGRVVYKPVAGGGWCRRASADDLSEQRLHALAAAPVVFQEEVPGRNVRAYVVGGRVVAAYEIASDDIDYRGRETAVVPIPLADDEDEACRRAAEACGMSFTGIDLKRGPDGRFAVLECNPSPMFAAIERRTGPPSVSEALADLLIGIA